MKNYYLLLIVVAFASCQELIDAPVPDLKWTAFDAAGTKPLLPLERNQLEGIYTITEADDDFGKEAAAKWSCVANATDTIYHLSFFCSEDVRYFICQGKRSDSVILLNGYWRNVENTKTGKAHFTIKLVSGQPVLIEGKYGKKDDEPDKKINFTYSRPLFNKTPYQIIAHRGGGRNNDLLPASENSVEMIQLATQLGANGIEIDVQLTKDSVPVLFHDANVNDRLTTKTGIHGPISDYTTAELDKDVKLKRGGKVPTLKLALETVLTKTALEFVWLDCKYKEVIPSVRALQKEFTEKALAAGRKLEIVIGVPDEKVMGSFMQLPDYKNIASLCELDTAKTIQMNAKIWATSWAKGIPDKEVDAMLAKGKKTLIWTVDIPDKIKEVVYRTRFNGLVTNRPTMAAYYYYSQQ